MFYDTSPCSFNLRLKVLARAKRSSLLVRSVFGEEKRLIKLTPGGGTGTETGRKTLFLNR